MSILAYNAVLDHLLDAAKLEEAGLTFRLDAVSTLSHSLFR